MFIVTLLPIKTMIYIFWERLTGEKSFETWHHFIKPFIIKGLIVSVFYFVANMLLSYQICFVFMSLEKGDAKFIQLRLQASTLISLSKSIPEMGSLPFLF